MHIEIEDMNSSTTILQNTFTVKLKGLPVIYTIGVPISLLCKAIQLLCRTLKTFLGIITCLFNSCTWLTLNITMTT